MTNEFLAKLQQDISQDEKRILVDHLKDALQSMPVCNACGNWFKADRNTTKVDVHWGYQSTGKDMDHDRWRLCQECTQKFNAQCEPICSMCKNSIVEVMAKLYSRRKGCTYYGDYDGALEHYRSTKHCGLEFAEVGDRIICEVCYDSFTQSFKIPIPKKEYDPFLGLEGLCSNPQRINRVEKALNFRLTEDAVSWFYEKWLEWDELVKVRKLSNKNQRIVCLSYRKSKPEFVAFAQQKNLEHPRLQGELTAQTGDNNYYKIDVSWLEEVAGPYNTLDLTDLGIEESGRVLRFGELRVLTQSIIDKFGNKDES